jgi:hypothetical protein
VEISVRNLLGNLGLDRNYVGGAARAERDVALENIFKFTRAGGLLRDYLSLP